MAKRNDAPTASACHFYTGWMRNCNLKGGKCNAERCEDFVTTPDYYDRLFAGIDDENTYISLADLRRVLIEDIASCGWIEDIMPQALMKRLKEHFVLRNMLCKR